MFSQMKTKSFFVLVTCIFATSVVLVLLSNQTPDFQSLVVETNKQIGGKLKDLQNIAAPQNLELQAADEKYMTLLGFTSHPKLFPRPLPKNITSPVIVAIITPARYKEATGFARSVKKYFTHNTFVLYSLLPSFDDNEKLRDYCNCTYRIFKTEKYPSYVSDFKLHAYRPIIIQEALDEFGSIIFLDPTVRLTTSNITSYLNRARGTGLLVWSLQSDIPIPTSALTHEKMFAFFNRKKEDYYFHRMAEPDNMIIFNTHAVHMNLMLPWLQCTLIFNCLAPIGAQDTGCNFDHKPLYLYTGCHRYDTSAFNIALGVKYRAEDYLGGEDKFYRHIVPGEPVMMEQEIANQTDTFAQNSPPFLCTT